MKQTTDDAFKAAFKKTFFERAIELNRSLLIFFRPVLDLLLNHIRSVQIRIQWKRYFFNRRPLTIILSNASLLKAGFAYHIQESNAW